MAWCQIKSTKNLFKYLSGAQRLGKSVSETKCGAQKIYNATVHGLNCKQMGKKYISGDTGAG